MNNELTIRKSFIDVIRTKDATCRMTKDIPNSNRMIILQVVDKEKGIGNFGKYFRKRAEKNKAIRVLHALETSRRVAGYIFSNIMSKEGK